MMENIKNIDALEMNMYRNYLKNTIGKFETDYAYYFS